MELGMLTEQEEKALVGTLYNHLVFGTTMEVFGEIKEEGIARLNTLRSIFSKLIAKYSLEEHIDAESYLVLGLPDMVAKETLQAFATNNNNKHLQSRAIYFLNHE